MHLLIAVGARFDDPERRAGWRPSARKPVIIHIDIDPAELDQIKTAHRHHSPAPGILNRLLPAVATNAAIGGSVSIAGRQNISPCRINDKPLSHFGLICTVACPDDEVVIATDVG